MCNFYYGKESKLLVSKKKTLPLNNNKEISFAHLEIISRRSKKKISIKEIDNLPKLLRKQINLDLKNIQSKKKNFANLNFQKIPNIMGVLNLTPDSFSDGGEFNSKKKGTDHALKMFQSGANIIDVGGESTRPGSNAINIKLEWSRIEKIIKSIGKKIPLSLDTRKSEIMEKGIKLGIKMINDVSGLSHDAKTIDILKKYKIPLVIQHTKGIPENMQNYPRYENELLDIYDFFEKKIKFLRTLIVSESCSNPETSLIIFMPCLIPFFIISDFLVSNEIGIFLLINLIIFSILFHSVLLTTAFDPGRVDSPPISIIFAPE